MMKNWYRAACGVLLVLVLAACGPFAAPPKKPTLEPTSPVPPTAEPTPMLGVQAAEPMPRYQMALRLDPVQQQIDGEQQVTYTNRTGTDLTEIVFRLYPNLPQYGGALTVNSVSVNGQSRPYELRASDTVLAIPLDPPLPNGNPVTLALDFVAQVPQVESGYVLYGYSQGIWSAPDAYPLLAVHDKVYLPQGLGSGWHEDIAPPHSDAVFAEAAFYDVTLTLPSSLTLACTGSVRRDDPSSNSTRTYHIVSGPLREFAWLASEDYRVAETTAYGKTLRSYYLVGDEAPGQAALTIAAAALGAYQDTYGPYPFEEMSVAQAPLQYYGMEYAGLNLIGAELYREKRDEMENRLVHEVAHQWWYAQVGNDQVNTPWLDEGLAEYSMAIYTNQVFGEARMNTLVNQRWLVPYQVAIENNYDRVVNQPSSAFSWEYEVIVYGKAALFFHALHQELGDDLFRNVLRNYVDRYRWKIATPDGFLQVAEQVSGRELDSLYSKWILSSQ